MQNKDLRAVLQTIASGDLAAFETLYHEMKVPVYTVLLRITRDRVLSEDLLQEFFLKLFRAPPVEARNPRAYLFQTAHNLALDALRSEKQTAPLDELSEPYAAAETTPMRLELELAFENLPLPERQIAALHLYGGLKFREIAEICALPLGTVLWRYRKAIGQLQNHLNGGNA